MRDTGMPKSPHDGSDSDQSQWYQITGIGVEFIASVVMLGIGGYYLDQWLGTRPWLMLAGGGLGFASGLWLMLKAARKAFHD